MLATAAAHHGHADPVTVVLILLAVVALWGLSLLGRPIGTCRTCRGERVIRTRTRVRPCRTCQATGYQRRTGATTIHRLYWTFLGERQRQQRREDLAARNDSTPPGH